jgi:hypothetical protein
MYADYVEQIGSESDSLSASQIIPRLLWNTYVHYHIYKSPSVDPIMGQMNPVYAFPPFLHKMYSNSIVPSMASRQSDPSLQMVKMKTQQETIYMFFC